MKTKLSILSMLLLMTAWTFTLSSCGDDPDPDEVAVSQNQVNFDASGGSVTIMLMSNTNWTITGMTSGFTVSPMAGSGNTPVTITASSTTTSRNCTLLVNAGKATAMVGVQQTVGVNNNLADRVVGTYVGRLYYGDEVLEDAYPIVVTKLNDRSVKVDAEFFDTPQNFTLSENMDQIEFQNTILANNITMYVTGSTLVVNYLSQGGNMIRYVGTK